MTFPHPSPLSRLSKVYPEWLVQVGSPIAKRLRKRTRWLRKRVRRYSGILWEWGIMRRYRPYPYRKLGEIRSTVVARIPGCLPAQVVPVALPGESHKDVKIGSQALAVYSTSDITFEPHQEFFWQGSRLFLQSLQIAPLENDPLEGHSLFSDISKANNKRYGLLDTAAIRKAIELPVGVILNGQFPSNWYHWSVSILPKAYIFETYCSSVSDAPFLVSKDVENTPMEALTKLLLPGREIKFIPNVAHRVRDAYIVESAVREVAHTRARHGAIDWTSMGGFHWTVMKDYRDTLLSIASCSEDKSVRQAPERVYLARRGDTRKFNEEETWQTLQEFGFTKVFVEDLGPDEQIRLFANGRYFVSTTGAQWTGIMFSTRAKGLLLAPRFLLPSTLFSKLASLGQSTISAMLMETTDKNWNEHFHSRSTSHISQPALARELSDMLGA